MKETPAIRAARLKREAEETGLPETDLKALDEAAEALRAGEVEDEDEEMPGVEIVAADPEPGAVVAPAKHRLLEGIDPEIAEMFSAEEVEAIFEGERKRALEEKRAAAKKLLRDRALLRARVEAGLVPETVLRSEEEQERLDEMVTLRFTLPKEGAGHRELGVRLDQKLYLSGVQYTVPRAVAETILDIVGHAWQHEYTFKGVPPSMMLGNPVTVQ